MSIESAAETIGIGHKLLSQALRVLGQPEARADIQLAADLLERCINAIDAKALVRAQPDVWLYFYEDFLAEYDPKLRRDRGVYYTPVEVVQAQVRLVARLLEDKFRKPLSFADDEVFFLDPAVGTGTYPLAALNHALLEVENQFGKGMIPARGSVFVQNLHAFEILVGPYAVSHLRITESLHALGVNISEPLKVLLTDTLESPHVQPPAQPSLLFRRLSEEHQRAQNVKAHTEILVCMGNPPYDRQVVGFDETKIDRKGGWVRFGEPDRDEEPILEAFLAPLRNAGLGVHAKNLYNDYVYFWRWALWKVFEQNPGSGIVCFITASSYLRGPGFLGMRRLMRQTCDHVWIIDLEGDSRGPRKTENVFAIQTPVAIAIAVRYGNPQREIKARVHYCKITGTAEDKLKTLAAVRNFSDLQWRECYSDWDEPMLPAGSGDYYSWPLVSDLFPWQHSGVQFKRNWPIGPTQAVLENRWRALLNAPSQARPSLLSETRDRKANTTYRPILNQEKRLRPLTDLGPDDPMQLPVRYGFRSFDRQWAIPDARVCDFPRPSLWSLQSPHQVYFASFLTEVMGSGPAVIASAEIPDLHYFRGSFGGKHIIPLWRDEAGTDANISSGVIQRIGCRLGMSITPQEFFAYFYCVLASTAYAQTFSEELVVPGPRLPITRSSLLFRRAARIGAALIWLHTFGQRFNTAASISGITLKGQARCTVGVSTVAAEYPDAFSYDEINRELHVGNGVFRPVGPQVWKFEVSGLLVVESWLRYRMKSGYGRRSSKLDEIRPKHWTAQLTEELLQTLWIIEATVAIQPTLAALLEEIVSGACFTAEELPRPGNSERRPPVADDDEAPNQQLELT